MATFDNLHCSLLNKEQLEFINNPQCIPSTFSATVFNKTAALKEITLLGKQLIKQPSHY